MNPNVPLPPRPVSQQSRNAADDVSSPTGIQGVSDAFARTNPAGVGTARPASVPMPDVPAAGVRMAGSDQVGVAGARGADMRGGIGTADRQPATAGVLAAAIAALLMTIWLLIEQTRYVMNYSEYYGSISGGITLYLRTSWPTALQGIMLIVCYAVTAGLLFYRKNVSGVLLMMSISLSAQIVYMVIWVAFIDFPQLRMYIQYRLSPWGVMILACYFIVFIVLLAWVSVIVVAWIRVRRGIGPETYARVWWLPGVLAISYYVVNPIKGLSAFFYYNAIGAFFYYNAIGSLSTSVWYWVTPLIQGVLDGVLFFAFFWWLAHPYRRKRAVPMMVGVAPVGYMVVPQGARYVQYAPDGSSVAMAGAPTDARSGAAPVLMPVYPGDAPSMGMAVLSFFFPVVGLILYLVWKDDRPLKARSAGKGALIGLITSVVVTVLGYVVMLAVFVSLG